MARCSFAGGQIEMSVARSVTIDFNGRRLDQRLSHEAQRLVVESLGLIAADDEGGADHIENV